MDKWKEIWNRKELDCSKNVTDIEEIFIKMKIADGYDAVGDCKIEFDDFMEQFRQIKFYLSGCKDNNKLNSVFEVGCGCGPNLLLFSDNGIKVGGIDYSSTLIDGARKFVTSDDLTVGEAAELSIEPKYDAVFSKGCFCYFKDIEYAQKVLDKMVLKARYAIGILELFDEEKKDEFLAYRRKTVANYDEKYKGLGKLFVSREFFESYAKKNNLKIVFTETNLNGYWNNKFVFNVYLYK